jgi:hypothetical protein
MVSQFRGSKTIKKGSGDNSLPFFNFTSDVVQAEFWVQLLIVNYQLIIEFNGSQQTAS